MRHIVVVTTIVLLVYFIGIVSVIALDLLRNTLKASKPYRKIRFKQLLLAFLDGEISDDEIIVLVIKCIFFPLGILITCFEMLIDLFSRTLFEKLRDWCRRP